MIDRRFLAVATLAVAVLTQFVACGGRVESDLGTWVVFDPGTGNEQDAGEVDDVQPAFGADSDTPAHAGVVLPGAPAAAPDDTPPGPTSHVKPPPPTPGGGGGT